MHGDHGVELGSDERAEDSKGEHSGGGLGKIARELGAFADFVQFGGGERSLGGRMGLAVAAVPTPDQCDQVSFAEGERPRGGQCIQQVCEDVREFVALLV